MKTFVRPLVLVATTALALGGLAACVDPGDEPSDPEVVGSADLELTTGPGTYLVANGLVGEAPFYVAVTVAASPGPETKRVKCTLAMGVDSATAQCPAVGSVPVTLVANDGVPEGQLIKVGFAPIATALANHGFTVLDIEADDEPTYHPAEAEWSWWNGWQCQASQADIDTCNNSICAGRGGGTVTVDEQFSSNNPYLEPGCEVTCTCGDGLEEDWIDPPQVLSY
jgi:hypothetical protein